MAGAAPPQGTVLSYVINEAGEVAETHVGDLSPALSSLGTVEKMAPTGTEATISRVDHRTFQRGHGQPKAKAATWGNGCKLGNTNHCYAQANWEMTGSERVLGAISEQNTSAMDVATWPEGAFVDDEMWVSFPSGGKGYEMEIGQEAGEHGGCCNLWWFEGWENANGYAQQTNYPYVWEIGYNGWANYGIKYVEGSAWCFYVGAGWEVQEGCVGGLATYSNRLTDGMEAADESEPANAGSAVASAEHLNGQWYTWNRATNERVNYKGEAQSHVCISQYAPQNYPGNINYGTC
jgi:hypothetical protein